MAEQNAVATQQGTQLSVAAQVKSMISQDAVKKKFTEVLGQKAPQFLASITNVVAGSAQLKKCPATTIMSAAFVAATYDLPIDSNLGFAAIVPYNNNKYNQQTRQWEKHPEAQFQMMYKGFIQLAIRSGYYEKMNCSVVYKDELVSYNPITGEVQFVTDFSKCTQRVEGKSENIAGYYAWFKLLTGFRKELFMTTAEVENHARKYSTAYRYDLENNKKGSKWTTDFEAMALKTVIKMLLSKWGMKAEKEALAGESTETPELPEPKEPVLPAEQKSNKAIGNYTTDFEELWEAYPRKVDKGQAYKKYKARLEDGFSHEQLYEAVKNYAAQCKKQRTETMYIKHGKTFLGESTPFLDYLPKDKPAQSEAEYDDNENPFGRSE